MTFSRREKIEERLVALGFYAMLAFTIFGPLIQEWVR